MTTRFLFRGALLLTLAFGLTGCGVLYDLGQHAAQKNCDSISDLPERQTCQKHNSMSRENYEKRRQAAKDGKPT